LLFADGIGIDEGVVQQVIADGDFLPAVVVLVALAAADISRMFLRCLLAGDTLPPV
jgi:hypothetical protein